MSLVVSKIMDQNGDLLIFDTRDRLAAFAIKVISSFWTVWLGYLIARDGSEIILEKMPRHTQPPRPQCQGNSRHYKYHREPSRLLWRSKLSSNIAVSFSSSCIIADNSGFPGISGNSLSSIFFDRKIAIFLVYAYVVFCVYNIFSDCVIRIVTRISTRRARNTCSISRWVFPLCSLQSTRFILSFQSIPPAHLPRKNVNKKQLINLSNLLWQLRRSDN